MKAILILFAFLFGCASQPPRAERQPAEAVGLHGAVIARSGGCDAFVKGRTFREYFEARDDLKMSPIGFYEQWTEKLKERQTKNKLAIPKGLRLDHLIVISAYGGAAYMTVNAALREGTVEGKNLRPFIECLSQALSFLPEHRGTVYRVNGPVSGNFDTDHARGSTVTYPAFTSTSKATKFMPGPDYAGYGITIQSIRGRDLIWLAPSQTAQEVLFDAGTCFKIDSRQDAKATGRSNGLVPFDKNVQIRMHEAVCPTS